MSLEKPKKGETDTEALTRIKSNTYNIVFRLLALFGFSALGAAVLGQWIDEKFGVAPFGTLTCMLVSFGLVWLIVFKYFLPSYKTLSKAVEDEEEEIKKEAEENEDLDGI